MHQPAAFCGGIAEMRKKEGCGKAIFVRGWEVFDPV